jgi:hypothetical protein
MSTIIYLDQKDWAHLDLAVRGRPHTSGDAEVAAAVIAAVEAGQIILPLSSAHRRGDVALVPVVEDALAGPRTPEVTPHGRTGGLGVTPALPGTLASRRHRE